MNELFSDRPALQKAKKPGNELYETVQEIIKVVGLTPKYGIGYWYGLVKRSKVSYSEIVGVLKEVEKADSKYSKGGMITNILLKKHGKNKQGKGSEERG